MKSVEMSRALTAAMSLRLPGTAGKLATRCAMSIPKDHCFMTGV